MRLRSVLLCLALICATVLAETHLIAGAFTSLGSKRATNLAVWDHTNSQWLDLHSVVERVSINSPLGATLSENGDLFWVGSDNNIERFSFAKADAAHTSPLYRVRMGGKQGVFIGNFQSIQVNDEGTVLYVCGIFTEIGDQISINDGLARIYQIPIENDYDFGSISDVSPLNLPVDCSSFVRLRGNRLLVVDAAGNLLQASTDSAASWTTITDTAVAIQRDIFGRLMVASYGAGIYAYGSSLSDTPFPAPASLTIQSHQDGTAENAWNQVLDAVSMSNFTVQQFAVGSQDEVYAVVTRGNVPEDVYYVHGSEGSNTLRRMAADYFFTSALNLSPITGFQIAFDHNIGALVVYGSNLNYVTYAPWSQLNDLTQYESFYAHRVPYAVRFNTGGTVSEGFWQPVYGGGFSQSPVAIIPVNGFTLAFGSFTFTFDNYTGPVAIFDDDLEQWVPLTESIDETTGFSVINFDPSVAGAGEINAIVHDEDLGIIVAGRFRTLSSGTVVHSITTFQSEQLSEALGNGFDVGVRVSTENTFEIANSVPGTIHDVLVHDGYIYVVGSFDLAGAISVNNVARFNTETSQWEDLLGGANGVVYAVREYDGKIVIGGSFDFVGSTTRANNIAAFNPDEGRWEVLNTGLDGPVYVLHSWDDDDFLIAGGQFGTASGVPIQHASLAAWDGKNWHSLSSLIDELDEDTCFARVCPTGAPTPVFDIFNYEDDQLFFLAGNAIHSFSDGGFSNGPFVRGLNVYSEAGVRSLVQSRDEWHDHDHNVIAAWNTLATQSSGALRTDFHAEDQNLLYTRAGVNNFVRDTHPDNIPAHGNDDWKIIVGVILGFVGLVLIVLLIFWLRKSGRLRNAKFWKRAADQDERQYRVEESTKRY